MGTVDTPDPELAEALQRLRRAMNMTQEHVAKLLGRHPITISRWEQGDRKPGEDDLAALAKLYRVTPAELRYGRSVREEGPGYQPRVALGLPRPIRLWIQEFLLELVKADVSEREVDEARRVLTSPELSRLLVGGEPSDESEAEILRGLEGFGAAIKDTLRSRGYSLRK